MSLEPLEHSVLGIPQDQRDVSSSDDDLRVDSQSVVLDDRGVDVAPVVGRPEAAQPPPEAGDAIVVGAVGSAAPWFLIGWAHEVEVEFMIDTGDFGYDDIQTNVYNGSEGALQVAALSK